MQIKIKNLVLPMIIGIFDYERKIKQKVHFDIDIDLIDNAGIEDNIENTLDYNALINELTEFKNTKYFLLEKLVDDMAEFVFKKSKFVKKVTVNADKGKLYKNVDKVVVSTIYPKE